MKYLRSLIALLLLVTAGAAQDAATIPPPSGYVNDFAGVLTPDGKADIDDICHEVHEKTKSQIFLVTVKSLGDTSIETYSNDLFHQWKIGEKKTDRGILVVLAITDHKWRIEVGYGLEGILPDAKTGAIGRHMLPSLQSADFDEAGAMAVREIADAIAADAKVTLKSTSAPLDSGVPATKAPPPAPASSKVDGRGGIAIVFLLVGFLGVFGLILWAIFRRPGRGSDTSYGFYDSGTSTDYSSVHSGESGSSSSDSFTGGDGGDSGGGGASGDW